MIYFKTLIWFYPNEGKFYKFEWYETSCRGFTMVMCLQWRTHSSSVHRPWMFIPDLDLCLILIGIKSVLPIPKSLPPLSIWISLVLEPEINHRIKDYGLKIQFMVNEAKVFTFSHWTSVLHLQLWSLRPSVESLNKPDERLDKLHKP